MTLLIESENMTNWRIEHYIITVTEHLIFQGEIFPLLL